MHLDTGLGLSQCAAVRRLRHGQCGRCSISVAHGCLQILDAVAEFSFVAMVEQQRRLRDFWPRSRVLAGGYSPFRREGAPVARQGTFGAGTENGGFVHGDNVDANYGGLSEYPTVASATCLNDALPVTSSRGPKSARHPPSRTSKRSQSSIVASRWEITTTVT